MKRIAVIVGTTLLFFALGYAIPAWAAWFVLGPAGEFQETMVRIIAVSAAGFGATLAITEKEWWKL